MPTVVYTNRMKPGFCMLWYSGCAKWVSDFYIKKYIQNEISCCTRFGTDSIILDVGQSLFPKKKVILYITKTITNLVGWTSRQNLMGDNIYSLTRLARDAAF